MSVAEKYGTVQSLPAAAKQKAVSEGQKLREKGVVEVSSLSGPATTAAKKYGAPVESGTMERSLSKGRSR